MMLMMISMAAGADVKVLYGKSGNDTFTGGKISATQEVQKDGQVAVTFTIKPDNVHTFTYTKTSLVIVSVYDPSSKSSTRADEVKVSEPLSVKGTEGTIRYPNYGEYTVTVDPNLGVWVQTVVFTESNRDTKNVSVPYPDYSGTYYIASDAILNNNRIYNENTHDDNYYLCPTEGWISFDTSGETSDTWTTGDAKPFLTTFKINIKHNDNDYDKTKAKWTIEYYGKENEIDYYYIKHSSGKYLVLNKQIDGVISNTNGHLRIRLHLENLSQDYLNNENTRNLALFAISPDGRSYVIDPKTEPTFYLTVNKGNGDYLTGENRNSGGTIKKDNITYGLAGTLGIFQGSNDATRYFWLEDVNPRPTITYNADNEIVITATSGATIIYTTNGTIPSSTNGKTYSVPFTIEDDDVTMIKAISIVDGKTSNVATYKPFVLLGANHKRLIQCQGNGWTEGNFQGNHFYMIPGDEEGEAPNKITKVNTTSMFRPSMQWYILHAGTTDDVTYYYIVNNDNRRIRYNSPNGNGRIYLDTWDENSANEFKFQIKETATAGTYNIIPYGVTDSKKYFNKTSGNAGDGALTLFDNATDGNSRWKFVKKDALVETAPFTVKEYNSITYYKLQNKATSYYVIPPSWTGGAVTVSNNSTNADIVNSRNWYFEVAQEPSDADWLTWYYIRNAVTGDYLYYSGPETSNDDAAFITKGSLNETNADDMKRYRFTWARSITVDNYFIVPQLLKDESQNTISGLNRNSTTLRIQKNRKDDGQLWQFVDPDYTVAPPSIVYNADANTVSLSCTTPGATIYYTTNNTETTTSATDSGSSPITIDLKAEGKESITIIRAIAEVSGTSSRETTNNIIVQTTVGNAKRPYLVRNNQSPWTVGGETMFVYYMIPCSDNTVNTSSIPQPAMEWNISLAGEEDGERYFYFCNTKTGGYLYHTSSTISMKTPTEKETLESEDDNGFKFYLKKRDANASSHAGYSIVPYGATNFVSKASGNNNVAAVKVEGTDNDYKRWNFVTKTEMLNDHNSTQPFTPSDGNTSNYYWIYNGNGGTHYMIPPASSTGNVTASEVDDATKKSGSWYFIKVQEPTEEDWVTYYKIINAETGKALYYAYTNNNSNCLKVGDYDGNDNTYKFAFIKSTVTDSYFIVPKSVISQQSASISTFWRSGSDIKPTSSPTRGSNSNDVCWTFTEASLFCNDPVFVEEDGKIKITCNTNAAKIYYTTDGTEPASTEFTDAIELLASTKYQIKAKAVVNETSSQTVTLLNKPDIILKNGDDVVGENTYTYDGNAKEPTVFEVSIGEAPNKTSAMGGTDYETVVSTDYSNNINASTDAVKAKVTLRDKASNIFVWHAEKEFKINPKEVGLTWNPVDQSDPTKTTFTYSGLAQAPTVTATGVVGTDDCTVTVTVTAGQGSSLTNDKAINAGSYTATVSPLENKNYKLPDAKTRTFTITRAPVTVTADNKTMGFGDPEPEWTATVTGMVNNENPNLITYTVSCNHGDENGTYDIIPSGAAEQGNYTVTYVKGTLIINAIKPLNKDDAGTPADGITIDVTYNGTAYQVVVTHKKAENDYVLVQGNDKDYTWTVASNTDPNHPEYDVVTVTGHGNYTGEAKAIYIRLTFYDTTPNNDTDGPETAAAYYATQNLQLSGGIEAWYVTNLENNTLTFEKVKVVEGENEISYLPENQPVLLFGDPSSTGFMLKPYMGTTMEIPATGDGANFLKVVTEDAGKAVNLGEVYVFSKGEFVLTMAGTLTKGKVYLDNPSYNSSSLSRGTLSASRGGTTGINDVWLSKTNDQFNEVWYALDGQKFNKKPTRKGIYLQNGKKVVIK